LPFSQTQEPVSTFLGEGLPPPGSRPIAGEEIKSKITIKIMRARDEWRIEDENDEHS